MTSEDEVNKPIHLRPRKRFAETLKTFMGIHKLDDKTEAIHRIVEEWVILTEQQQAYLNDSKPISQTFSFPCDYRGKDDKGKPLCRNKHAPILTKSLEPNACEQCLRLRVLNINNVVGFCPTCNRRTEKLVLHETIPKTRCVICGQTEILNLAWE